MAADIQTKPESLMNFVTDAQATEEYLTSAKDQLAGSAQSPGGCGGGGNQPCSQFVTDDADSVRTAAQFVTGLGQGVRAFRVGVRAAVGHYQRTEVEIGAKFTELMPREKGLPDRDPVFDRVATDELRSAHGG